MSLHLRSLPSPNLACALEYAKLGLPVVPLRDESKVPRVHAWQDRASCDPRVVRTWFRRWPGSNVGILTGHGRIVIDIDAKSSGERSFRRLVGRRKFPATATAFTGGGGRHLWLAVPEPVGCSQGFLGLSGIDVRGRGGTASGTT